MRSHDKVGFFSPSILSWQHFILFSTRASSLLVRVENPREIFLQVLTLNWNRKPLIRLRNFAKTNGPILLISDSIYGRKYK